MFALDDLNTDYKDAIIPHLITQELMSLNTVSFKQPNFWVRKKTQSSAEIDLVYPFEDKVIPIEIKSLHQFMERVSHPFSVRMYAGEFCIEQNKTPIGKKTFLLMNMPYYLGTKLPEYITFFVQNYKLENTEE